MRSDIDIYADNLLVPEKELRKKKLNEDTVIRILRLRDIYNYMLRNPLKKDREYVDYIVYNSAKLGNGEEITRRTAYADLEILHAIVGTLQNCGKEWHRWRFNNMIMEGYRIAVDKEDAAAIAKLASAYGKYNKLDKEDEKDARYEEIPQIKFTFDVTILGLKPIPNLSTVIQQMEKKYSGSAISYIEADAEVLELGKKEEQKQLELKDAEDATTIS